MSLSYKENLLDKRWKEKREQIVRRDGNQCKNCQSEYNLQVHHCYYDSKEPWEYEDQSLVTLCQKCHEYETLYLDKMKKMMNDAISRKGVSADIFDSLVFAFQNCHLHGDDKTAWRALCWAIRTPPIMIAIIDAFKSMEDKNVQN